MAVVRCGNRGIASAVFAASYFTCGKEPIRRWFFCRQQLVWTVEAIVQTAGFSEREHLREAEGRREEQFQRNLGRKF
jgi:hypothetical protein